MFVYYFCRLVLFVLHKLFFHLEIRGRRFIPQKGGFIVVSNHASFLDPIVLGVSTNRILNYAARDTLFRNRFFGWLLRQCGSFPIRRWSADLSAVKEAVRRLKKGAGLVVFPEGTRSQDGQVQEITRGFVLLAKKAGVPIIPAWISGSAKAWGKGRKMITLAKIKVAFGRPFYVESGLSHSQIAEETFRQIKLLTKREIY